LAYIRFASVAARLERWPQAAQYTKAVLDLDPLATPEAYALFSLANLKLKHFDIAESSARQGLRIDPDHGYPELHLLLAQALSGRGDYKESAQYLEQYLALVPDDANASLIRHEISRILAPAANHNHEKNDP
jgi:tetratricopeptide (TPR) repeat protein